MCLRLLQETVLRNSTYEFTALNQPRINYILCAPLTPCSGLDCQYLGTHSQLPRHENTYSTHARFEGPLTFLTTWNPARLPRRNFRLPPQTTRMDHAFQKSQSPASLADHGIRAFHLPGREVSLAACREAGSRRRSRTRDAGAGAMTRKSGPRCLEGLAGGRAGGGGSCSCM